eukprot:SAG22_NODE_120_length_19227_cov_7.584013_2_plen_104_part_00
MQTTTTTTTTTTAGGTTTTTTTTTTTSTAAAPAAPPAAAAAASAAAEREALLRGQYPKCADDITAAWLGALLQGADVSEFTLKIIEAGVVSDACVRALKSVDF